MSKCGLVMLIGCLWLITIARAEDSFPRQGLVLWFDATDSATLQREGDYIVAWRSKAASHAVQLVAADKARPRFDAGVASHLRSGVVFDGRNDVLKALDFKRRFDTWTLLMVVAPNRGNDMNALISACPAGGNDYDPGFNVDLYKSGDHFDNLNVEGAGRLGGQQNLMTSALPYDGFHCVTVVRDPAAIRILIDGQPQGTRPMAPATTIMDELRLGVRFYVSRQCHYFDGSVA